MIRETRVIKMKKKKYDISIIIPVYNTEKWVAQTLNSVLDQDYDISKIQLVIINDGSTDNSDDIIKPYVEKYDNICYVKKENEGLSKTRNLALSLSEGRYILFLDSDDTISPDTIKSIVPFFDEHYDEIDLVSYKIVPVVNGIPQEKLHYRYRFLTQTGIYDLTKKENWFVSITTMNYCIKNQFKNNVLFDTRPGFFHEDQKFSMDIIKNKMKIGYVDTGTYWYLQQPNSITKTRFYAYYLFETTMSFWEAFFKQFKDNVPEYYQALFMNDLNWKNKAGILMPYQYEGKKFAEEFGRITALLSKVNDDVILYHPGLDIYHKYYWLDLKNEKKDKKEVLSFRDAIAVASDKNIIWADSKINIDLLKFRIVDNKIKMMICIKSPAFLYEQEIPKVIVAFDEEDIKKEEFPVRESSFSYYQCKEKCAKFYLSELEIDYQKISMFKVYISLHDHLISSRFFFPQGNVFSDKLERYHYINNGYIFTYSKRRDYFQIEKATRKTKWAIRMNRFIYHFTDDKKKLLVRIMCRLYHPRKPIWLYYDCKGVKKDNGYYQFIHDLEIKDGIKRYYVSNNSKEFNKDIFNRKQKRKVIKFHSLKHKFMYLKASKIITAYIEQENSSPYTKNAYTYYIDIANIPEIIYLQHGILHAHLPWKYSLDRLPLDKEVISTYYERDNFINNYAFTKDHLIDCGMPRYDFLNSDVKKTNTILYAPSWRSYLVGKQVTNYAKMEKTFVESEFYIESKKFLESKELADMLEKYDFTLNFKLHPIFKKYQYLYQINNERIKIGADWPDSEYKVFITDFSSYVFDFVYLKRAIIYFVPDYVKFKSGMNLYRELDFKFDNGIGDFSQDYKTTLKQLKEILKNGGEPSKDKLQKMNNFFIHNDHHQRDRLYETLIKEK